MLLARRRSREIARAMCRSSERPNAPAMGCAPEKVLGIITPAARSVVSDKLTGKRATGVRTREAGQRSCAARSLFRLPLLASRLPRYFGNTDTGSICARISPTGLSCVCTFTYVRPRRISVSSESSEMPGSSMFDAE